MPYKESKHFLQKQQSHQQSIKKFIQTSTLTVQETLQQHILQSGPSGQLSNTISQIDQFCKNNWMMNVGPEKITIIQHYIKDKDIKNVLQIGGYCGYSALQFCRIMPNATVHTIQINENYANIARSIQKHAGVSQRIQIHVGTVQKLKQQIIDNGPYDMIFLDHEKSVYLQDYLLLQQYGVIKKGTIIAADNIVYPGSPDYFAYFKTSQQYDSVLQHGFVQYCDIPDAILMSVKINDHKK